MAKRYIKIKIDCCGDCPYYNYRRHKCLKGAMKENRAYDPFYDDCPLEWEEIEHEEDEQ